MRSSILLSAAGAGLVLAQGQGLGYPPPPPQTLTATKSGVLPALPTETPFTGLLTLEGAIINKGPANNTFQPLLGPAVVASNQVAAVYQAVLPSTNFNNGTGSTLTGQVTITAMQGGTGVQVSVRIQGAPDVATYGPFGYHIHDVAVPADGNCTATLGHFDPTNRGEYYPCVKSNLASCQVGDLSGKHGTINATSVSLDYSDMYLSTIPGNVNFFGAKSIVFHTKNTTRITCANFQLVNGGSSASGTASGTAPVSTFKGDAGRVAVAGTSAAGFIAAIAAFLF